MTTHVQDPDRGSGYRAESAASAFGRVVRGESAQIALGDFLDDWRRTSLRDRLSLMSEPLSATRDRDLIRWAAYFAATVEQLCAVDGLEAPAWTRRGEYRLREPWFLLPGTALRAWLLVSTPVPFKRRNIFTGESSLDRV